MSATRVRKPKVTLTERTLISMLTENTGRHMLDSGGAYGRAWERNQGVDFKASPAATWRIRPYAEGAEIEVTLDLFHWLAERVEYDPHMTGQFTRFANKPENQDSHWLELAESFASDVRKGHGIYGDGDPMTINTYNGEDLLSQTIQYVYWTEGEYGCRDEYILLQIHGGCDVRGGYTAPKVFRCSIEEQSIMDNAKACIVEAVPEHLKGQAALPGMEAVGRINPYWTTDDACHWYFEGGCGASAGKQLEDYEVSSDPADKGNGKIYVDDDGVAYGPLYGGKLEVYAE